MVNRSGEEKLTTLNKEVRMNKLKNVFWYLVFFILIIVAGFCLAYIFTYPGFLAAMMAILAVSLFLGVLAMTDSGEANTLPINERMRLALSATIIVEFFVYFGAILFLKDEVLIITGELLEFLATVVGSVIAFYFAAEAAKRISKNRSGTKIKLAIIDASEIDTEAKKQLISLIDQEFNKKGDEKDSNGDNGKPKE